MAQDRIHKGSGGTFAGALDQFDAFIDSGARGNAIEPAELIKAETECSKNLKIEFGQVVGPSSGLFASQAEIASAEHP